MPRHHRLDFPGARHHVMNRGARREPIFKTDEDCRLFLDVLASTASRFGLHVHAYALMENHFHLVLSTPRGNLSAAMAFLQSRFTRQMNLRHRWDGPIFRGRYLGRLVETDAYFRHLVAYLHLNPVAAHLVGAPEDAVWTSHRAYLGLDAAPPWLHTPEVLEQFGTPAALGAYVHAVQIGRERGPADFDAARFWSPVKVTPPTGVPGVRAPQDALADVVRVTGRPEAAVRATVRGAQGNPARRLAMWWFREASGMGTNAIARWFGAKGTAASRAIRAASADEDPTFVAWREALLAS